MDEFTYLMLSGYTMICHISMVNHISYFEIKKALIIFGQNLQLLAIVPGVTNEVQHKDETLSSSEPCYIHCELNMGK